MKLPVDQRYREERRRFDLRLHCEDCALFEDASSSCAHGYPTIEHRKPAEPEHESDVVFCKDFELA